MIYGVDNIKKQNIQIPISNYAEQLAWYLEFYLNRVDQQSTEFSGKDTEKAKIYLKWFVFPNHKEFEKDLKKIENDIHTRTWNVIEHYTRCIMQLLGQVAECVVVERCINDKEVNKICINVARFQKWIYTEYSDIDYDAYMAFSTSFKCIIYKDEKTNLYRQYNVPDYNPNHTSKDIAWCLKKNILSQLKVDIKEMGYLENAKLQIKATLNSKALDLKNYFITPVICFDLLNDCDKLKQKYPNNIIYSARDICPEMYMEVDKYFRILSAYATGLIDHINITDIEVEQDFRLAELFRTPIMALIKEKELNIAGVIDMANDYQKPIVVNG